MRGAGSGSRESNKPDFATNFDLVAVAESVSRAVANSHGPDEAVLREIRHELGNHFHKLYYWADFVQESVGGEDADPLGDPLTGAIQKLESFLNRAMQYLTPISLETVGMNLSEVTCAIEKLLVGEVPQAKVRVETLPGVTEQRVQIDPGKFSAAIQTVARALNQASDGSLLGYRMTVSTAESLRALEFRMDAAPALQSAVAQEVRTLDWANAQRTIETHGGTLSLCELEDGTMQVCLVLPWDV